jgi:hypothetical protein
MCSADSASSQRRSEHLIFITGFIISFIVFVFLMIRFSGFRNGCMNPIHHSTNPKDAGVGFDLTRSYGFGEPPLHAKTFQLTPFFQHSGH